MIYVRLGDDRINDLNNKIEKLYSAIKKLSNPIAKWVYTTKVDSLTEIVSKWEEDRLVTHREILKMEAELLRISNKLGVTIDA